jgi:hypothetical protein
VPSTPTRRKSIINVTRQSVSLSPPGPAAAAHRNSAPAAADVAEATSTSIAASSSASSSAKSLKRSQHRAPEKVGVAAGAAALIPEVSACMHAYSYKV